MGRIVVGIDGSSNGQRALEWGLEEAQLRGWELELVQAAPPAGMLDAVTSMSSREELERAAEHLLEQVLEDVVLARVDTGDLVVHRTVRSGAAAEVLCSVAEGADLLVVGARGRGGFTERMLGSVASQVVQHAPCPVLVVGPERAASGD
jgi:nucleotide-binding universal stress UspA family protein